MKSSMDGSIHSLSSQLSAWATSVSTDGFSNSPLAFEAFTDLLSQCSKSKMEFDLQDHELNVVLAGAVFYNEILGNKESERNLAVFAKCFMKTRDVRIKLLQNLISFLPKNFRPKYVLLAQCVEDMDKESVLRILGECETLAECQVLSAYPMPFLIRLLPSSGYREWLLRVSTSRDRNTRVNVHRHWIGRMIRVPSLLPVLQFLLEDSFDAFLIASSSIFPLMDAHDITSMDPTWRWKEEDDRWSPRESCLFCVLSLLNVLFKKSAKCVDTGKFSAALNEGLCSPVGEIRLLAIRIVVSHPSTRDVVQCNDEQLILDNIDTDCELIFHEVSSFANQLSLSHATVQELKKRLKGDTLLQSNAVLLILDILEKYGDGEWRNYLFHEEQSVRKHVKRRVETMTEEEREEGWKRIREGQGDIRTDAIGWIQLIESQRVWQYIDGIRNSDPCGWLECVCAWIRSSRKAVPWETLSVVREMVQCLLVQSGSRDSCSCPTFAEMSVNLAPFGISEKMMGKQLVGCLSVLVEATKVEACTIQEVEELLLDVLVRCRLKAVVDGGLALAGRVLSPERAPGLFQKCLSYVSDPNMECRSSPLARLVFMCCTVDPNLVGQVEEWLSSVLDAHQHAIVLIRSLKMLKVFVSRKDVALSSRLVEKLFFVCIDLHSSSNYLVRSASICLYGFVVRWLSVARPLFCSMSIRRAFCVRVLNELSSISSLPSLPSILLLVFLSQHTWVHDIFYGEQVCSLVNRVRASLSSFVLSAKEDRMMRFGVDGLLSILDEQQRTFLQENVLPDKCGLYILQAISGEFAGGLLAFSSLRNSRFYNILRFVANKENKVSCCLEKLIPLESISEQGAQTLAVGLTILMRRNDANQEETKMISEIVFRLKGHSRERIRSLAHQIITN